MRTVPPSSPISNGQHAVELIGNTTRKLVSLQSPVLADRDPEPLHQMRVSMRRLRTCLGQFGPALVLPSAVSERRIAKVGHRLGMARDLDVLRHRLVHDLLPRLPEEERRELKPVLKQLRRERRIAYRQLVDALQSSAYLKVLSRLQQWGKKPELTPLGRQPLDDWLVDWQLPAVAPIFLHPGWYVIDRNEDPETVHDLRKRCKGARYAMENLRSCSGVRARAWIDRFRRCQDLLGELNDLEVLGRAIDDQLDDGVENTLPGLHELLQEQACRCWSRWRDLAGELLRPSHRHQALAVLLLDRPARRGDRRRLPGRLWREIERCW